MMVAAMWPLLRHVLTKRRAAPLRMTALSSCICIGNAAELQSTAEINSAQWDKAQRRLTPLNHKNHKHEQKHND